MQLTKEYCDKYFLWAGRSHEWTGYIFVACQVSCFMQDCWQANIIGISWLVFGLLWFFSRVAIEALKEKMSFLEMLITASVVSGIATRVVVWPIDMYYFFFTDGPLSSFRRELQLQIYKRGPRYEKWAYGKEDIKYDEWYLRETLNMIAEWESSISEESDAIAKLPETVELQTRTACACGATIVVAQTAQPALAEDSITLSSTGWMTSIVHATSPDPLITVPDARLRTTASFSKEVSLFGDIDFLELVLNSPNWWKMAELNLQIGEEDGLHFGRIPKSAVFNLPDPYVQETVSYPRVPYNFFGFGMQYERREGDTHIVADITASSKQPFSDGGQWNALETSMRVDHNFTPHLNTALAVWIDSTRAVNSADLKWRGDFFVLKAMFYGSSTGETGANVLGSLRLIPTTPNLDIHGMLDYDRINSTSSLWWSSGIGLRGKADIWSATIDYEDHGEKNRGVVARVIRRF